MQLHTCLLAAALLTLVGCGKASEQASAPKKDQEPVGKTKESPASIGNHSDKTDPNAIDSNPGKKANPENAGDKTDSTSDHPAGEPQKTPANQTPKPTNTGFESVESPESESESTSKNPAKPETSEEPALADDPDDPAATAKQIILTYENQDSPATEDLVTLGKALLTYHDTVGKLPAAASYDSAGKPLLSWRVQILPYLGQHELYKKFNLAEPWDSDTNKPLLEQMPDVFAPEGTAAAGKTKTPYLAPVGKGAIFDGKEGLPLANIKDGLGHTILLIEVDAASSVPWTKPADLELSDLTAQDTELPKLAPARPAGSAALFADGHVQVLKPATSPAALEALFTISAGDSVPSPKAE